MHIFSIGHSSLEYADFLRRLRAAHITAVADVRSSPFSRNFPQFNRDVLSANLARDGIAYVPLGKELGGRPADSNLFADGVADYEKMALSPAFRLGIDRVEKGARKYCVALMCSERSPFDCHRCLLVGRALKENGHSIRHILDSGATISQDDIEERLLEMANLHGEDMFLSKRDRINNAYRARALKIAYSNTGSSSEGELPIGISRL